MTDTRGEPETVEVRRGDLEFLRGYLNGGECRHAPIRRLFAAADPPDTAEDEVVECLSAAWVRDNWNEHYHPQSQQEYRERMQAALSGLPSPVRAALLDAWREHRDGGSEQ